MLPLIACCASHIWFKISPAVSYHIGMRRTARSRRFALIGFHKPGWLILTIASDIAALLHPIWTRLDDKALNRTPQSAKLK